MFNEYNMAYDICRHASCNALAFSNFNIRNLINNKQRMILYHLS